MWSNDLFHKGLRKVVGDGCDTDFFYDPWIPRASIFRRISVNKDVDSKLLVVEFITGDNVWYVEKLINYVREEDVKSIPEIPISCSRGVDIVGCDIIGIKVSIQSKLL